MRGERAAWTTATTTTKARTTTTKDDDDDETTTATTDNDDGPSQRQLPSTLRTQTYSFSTQHIPSYHPPSPLIVRRSELSIHPVPSSVTVSRPPLRLHPPLSFALNEYTTRVRAAQKKRHHPLRHWTTQTTIALVKKKGADEYSRSSSQGQGPQVKGIGSLVSVVEDSKEVPAPIALRGA